MFAERKAIIILIVIKLDLLQVVTTKLYCVDIVIPSA